VFEKGVWEMGHEKKGVTPVIATILLVASTVVLALSVGAYTYGILGSNVKTIHLDSANLYGGTLHLKPTCSDEKDAYMNVALSNPGEATNISSVTITGSSLTTTVQAYYLKGGACTQISPTTQPGINAGNITSVTLYFGAGGSRPSLNTDQTFNYVITLANGQSVSGALVAG
jgi:flagellin-like protein